MDLNFFRLFLLFIFFVSFCNCILSSTIPSLIHRTELEGKTQMTVDETGITSIDTSERYAQICSSDHSESPSSERYFTKMEKDQQPVSSNSSKQEQSATDRSPGKLRSKSNQRWMKLRTTVQLSGAISNTNQKSKAPLKREDSFLKRFSTRQTPETQETVDTGDEMETHNESQTQNEVNRRRRKRRKEMSKTVVNPDENFYFCWLMTVTVCVLYNLWTLIVRQSFPEMQRAASVFWYSGDGLTDIVFVCDIMVQFRTGYLEQGLMVYNSKKLATHYLKSRAFILDTLSLVPLDFLQFNIGVNPLLRFPRFLKVYRVYNYYYMVESRTVYPNLWRVVNLIHILLILAHWFGCFYYLLSEAEGFQGDWVYPHRPGEYATLTRKYLGSLYWSTLTLTTIGDLPTPETNAEAILEGSSKEVGQSTGFSVRSRGRSKAMTSSGRSEGIPRRGHKSRLLQFNSDYGYLFTIVSYLIGVFIFATIVGQVGNVITNRNANRLEFERLLDGAKTYMRHHKVPGGMKRRVLRWYDYSWSRGRIQGGGDINTALGLLPDKLKTELALHVNLSVLKKVTIFQECQPEFLHDLVLKMKAYIFTPGDLICRKGEVAREMFIIADGILDVISDTGRVLTTMKAGDFFGEIGILNLDGLNKRTADVRSVGYSELFSLSREDVLTAMKDYPEAQDILQSLGRKRLMEAKNASKVLRAQARQSKDHDSSGDSDAAGKRIVEKLRSDVKGLRKVLRRSRRGARTNTTTDEAVDTNAKKHSTLRRMSHVQSSDECETTIDPDPVPIGAGLPLLQRLKILKEKQQRDGEGKESMKKTSDSDESSVKRNDNDSPEKPASGSLFSQKVTLLKQKETREIQGFGFGGVPSTVRTQVMGTQLDRSSTKPKIFTFSRVLGEAIENKPVEEKNHVESKEKVGTEAVRIFLKERLKIIDGEKNLQEEKILSPPTLQKKEAVRNMDSNSSIETDIKFPTDQLLATKPDSSVAKSARNAFMVPVNKDGWKLLKISSISCSRLKGQPDDGEEKLVRKVSKTGAFLSKSDTVLERQTSATTNEERRSRSTSPSYGSQSQKRIASEWTKEKKILTSTGHPLKLGEKECEISCSHIMNSSSVKAPKIHSNHSVEQAPKQIKKYSSICDLSPEYSGLPFVKKLKILNERQKLEELEKELIVRSASLDVSERPKEKLGKALVRSRSEATAAEYDGESYFERGKAVIWGVPDPTEIEKSLRSLNSKWHSKRVRTSVRMMEFNVFRNSIDGDEKDGAEGFTLRCSEGSIPSPESNETFERRRLKSILKKLSGEGSTSDEDKTSRGVKRGFSLSRQHNSSEFRKLMREPTMEGYVARHKKLTKSVTFDSDALPSPLCDVPEQSLNDTKATGCTPTSPTAILTLQLSNLSMVPIVNSKKGNKGKKLAEEEKNSCQESLETQSVATGMTRLPESGNQSPFENGHNVLLPSSVQDLMENKFTTLPFIGNQNEYFFKEMEEDILETVRQVLEKAYKKFHWHFSSLYQEVTKRDEIISHLQSKIRENEKNKNSENLKNNGSAEGNVTDYDFSNDIFQREDFCESVRDVRPRKAFDLSKPPDNRRGKLNDLQKRTQNRLVFSSQPSGPPLNKQFFNEFLRPEETIKNRKSVGGAKDNIDLLPTRNGTAGFLKRGLHKCFEPTSEEETELAEPGEPFRAGHFGKQRREGSTDESHFRAEYGIENAEKFGNRLSECGGKGGFFNRMTKFQRSINNCQEKKSEYIALEIDDSSTSSDVETAHNEDWEVEMLIEELAKKDPFWKKRGMNWEFSQEGDLDNLEDVENLREEVNSLKNVVYDRNLSRLTSSELDILESVIEAKDEKIIRLFKSNSFEGAKRVASIKPSRVESKLKESEQGRKASLKHKIGLALSFDFHDIESRQSKVPKSLKHRKSGLKILKTFSGSHRGYQSLYQLWWTNTRLRRKVLNESDKRIHNLTIGKAMSTTSRSSLPILIHASPDHKETPAFTSLPFLCAKDFTPNFGESFCASAATPHLSADSFEEAPCDSYCMEVEDEALSKPEFPVSNALSGSDHATKSLNSFIRSVGRKVRQAVAGDANVVPKQVPTISRLLEQHLTPKGLKGTVSATPGVLGGEPSREGASPIACRAFEALGPIDRCSGANATDL